jgi:hypothetical protein
MAGALRGAMKANPTVMVAALFLAMAACSGAPGEDVDATSQAVSVHTVHSVTTISYAPNSFVIGNAYPGWHDDVQGDPQSSRGPGNWGGASYRWGMLYGEHFDRCAWINDSASSGTDEIQGDDKCGAPQEIDTPYFFRTYTNGIHNDLAGDGSPTHMHYDGAGCNDLNGYGNVDPWRVPAVPSNSRGVVPDGQTLLWRYVSKDGKWVLVRDPAESGKDSPNWYFVHRGCISLSDGYEDAN